MVELYKASLCCIHAGLVWCIIHPFSLIPKKCIAFLSSCAPQTKEHRVADVMIKAKMFAQAYQ